jgi:hypothetical protein
MPWRNRLRMAEAAAHRRGLEGTLASYRETVAPAGRTPVIRFAKKH